MQEIVLQQIYAQMHYTVFFVFTHMYTNMQTYIDLRNMCVCVCEEHIGVVCVCVHTCKRKLIIYAPVVPTNFNLQLLHATFA